MRLLRAGCGALAMATVHMDTNLGDAAQTIPAFGVGTVKFWHFITDDKTVFSTQDVGGGNPNTAGNNQLVCHFAGLYFAALETRWDQTAPAYTHGSILNFGGATSQGLWGVSGISQTRTEPPVFGGQNNCWDVGIHMLNVAPNTLAITANNYDAGNPRNIIYATLTCVFFGAASFGSFVYG